MPDLVFAVLPEGIFPLTALALVVASFGTSLMTAVFGIGGGVALLAIMGFLLPVSALVPVHGVVQMGSNLGRSQALFDAISWKTLTPFAVGGILGALVGAFVVVELPDTALKLILGLFVLLVVWVKPPALSALAWRGLGLGGAISTLASMFVGASGPLVAALLERQFGQRHAFVATHAAAMSFQHAIKALAFGFAGFAFSDWFVLIGAMIATGYLGTLLGVRALGRIEESRFRQIFKWVMTVLAINLMAAAAIALANGS